MTQRWYVARTTPLAEYVARDHLKMAGLEVFLPCGQSRTRRAGHQDTPLFPGYLFLRYDLETQGWGSLRRFPQLVGLVTFGGEVPSVPDEIIDELAVRAETMSGRGGLWPRYQPGDKVSVSVGPIESLAEVVEGARSPTARVRVMLEFLGRLIEAEVPWQDVQPMGAYQANSNWNERRPRRTRGGGRWIRGFGPRTEG